jgi:hypothetical protein
MGIETGRATRLFRGRHSVSYLIALVCAVLASLASGVLLAYGICAAFFRLVGNGRSPSLNAALVPERAVALEN